MGGLVLYSVEDGIGTLVLHRPERLNAIDADMINEMLDVLRQASVDRSVRSLILTGAGRGFCAGGDLAVLGGGASGGTGSNPGSAPEASTSARAANLRALMEATELLYEMPKLTVAAVNGPCAGAGLSLACATDVRISARSAIFTTAFVRVGQTGDYGVSWLLPRIVGPAKARELLLLSERIDASEAARLGLVSSVVPDEELLASARSLARAVSEFSPLALAAMKANLHDAATSTLSESLSNEAVRMAENSQLHDTREAVAAFREGRSPVFEGR